jgi:hypothetical protein
MEKRYRVEYNRFGIVGVQEDGAFNTASGNSIIADTLANIRLMLTALGVDCSALDSYSG